jgi:ubiquinone/menaquinone biosynthesis C-methylase UbiE
MASKTFHSLHSTTYDRMASKSTYNIAKTIIPALFPPITPSSYILDNACGSGIVSALIKAQYPFAHIKGVDLAPGMIDVFKAHAEANKWENVEADILDVRDLKTLEDESFSHVITNFGFASDVKDASGPLRAAREMHRVLKTGGVCVVTTWAGMSHFLNLSCGKREADPSLRAEFSRSV